MTFPEPFLSKFFLFPRAIPELFSSDGRYWASAGRSRRVFLIFLFTSFQRSCPLMYKASFTSLNLPEDLAWIKHESCFELEELQKKSLSFLRMRHGALQSVQARWGQNIGQYFKAHLTFVVSFGSCSRPGKVLYSKTLHLTFLSLRTYKTYLDTLYPALLAWQKL